MGTSYRAPEVYVPRSPTRRSDKRLNQIAGDLPFLLGILVLTGFALVFQLYPGLIEKSAIGVTFPPLGARAWAALLLIGCVSIYVSLWKLDARWDVAGCLSIAAWAMSYSYAVFVVRGPSTGFVACSVFTALFVLCAGRAFVLAYEPQVKLWRSRR